MIPLHIMVKYPHRLVAALSPRLRCWVSVAGMASAAAIAAFGLEEKLPLVRAAADWADDLRAAVLRPAMPQSRDIVLLEIGEQTLARFAYRSPIDRVYLRDLLRRIDAARPAAIIVDLLFDQPTEPDKDAALAAAVAELEAPAAIAFTDEADGLSPEQAIFLAEFVPADRRAYPGVVADSGDHVVRAFLLRRRLASGAEIPGLAAAVAARLGKSLPGAERLRIDWRGAPEGQDDAFATVPAESIDLVVPALFTGKVVLIGVNLPLTDRFPTPLSRLSSAYGTLPGIEIHAHALAQLLEGRRAPEISASGALAAVALAAGAGVLVAAANIGLAARLAVAASCLITFWAASGALLAFGVARLSMVAPALAFVASLSLADFRLRRDERATKQFIRTAFSRFMPPALVEALVANPALLTRSAERREMSYLFTDIADFTTLSEGTDPAVLAPILNAYFDGMCAAAFRHGGTVDKFIGDAVFVLFGAPIPQADHAERAIRAALDMAAFATRFSARTREQGIPLGRTRIGLHTGSAMIGNFGSSERFTYTPMGDAVNTAARIEGLNKYFGTSVCASAATLAACPTWPFRPIAEVVVKGRSAGLLVGEPVTPEQAETPAFSAYRAAYEAFAAGRPEAAAFEALAGQGPADPLSAFQLRRIRDGARDTRLVMADK